MSGRSAEAITTVSSAVVMLREAPLDPSAAVISRATLSEGQFPANCSQALSLAGKQQRLALFGDLYLHCFH